MTSAAKKSSILIYPIYGITIFVSAFLLFQIQPLISKYILPWFGGTTSVWTICMIFFQAVLLLGYLYAHFITKYFSNKKQIFIHSAFLIGSIAFLPILPSSAWKPETSDIPELQILLMLFASIGLPILILSATSPLIQSWISKINQKKSPYKLYALSNAGSLIALISFPFLFEPLLPISTQATVWLGIFIAFILFCFVSAIALWKYGQPIKQILKQQTEKILKPTKKLKFYWISLAFITSTLFLAVTNKVSQEISVVPFFWVVPLSLYLLTFIIAFSKKEKKDYHSTNLFLYVIFIFIISVLVFTGLENIFIQLAIYSILLFLFCLVCHTELSRLKPHSNYLTSFYLIIAFGGVLGGIFTGIIAPIIFNSYIELIIAFVVCALISLFVLLKIKGIYLELSLLKPKLVQITLTTRHKQLIKKTKLSNFFTIAILIGLIIFSSSGVIYFIKKDKSIYTVEQTRNFYSTLAVKVKKSEEHNEHAIMLISGNIMHGTQSLEQEKRGQPTSYYTTGSGINRLFKVLAEKNQTLRIGAIGLGTGTISAYGKEGDYFNYYEINPEVERLCKKYFSYLFDKNIDFKITLGDARINLEKENSQNYDVFVLDAFTDDAIPIHLLTKEAFEIYLKHLAKNGIIAAHISNKHIDLEPVVHKIAQHFNMQAITISNMIQSDILHTNTSSAWVLISKNQELLNSDIIQQKVSTENVDLEKQDLWTDDYSNIFKVLK